MIGAILNYILIAQVGFEPEIDSLGTRPEVITGRQAKFHWRADRANTVRIST